MAPSTIALIQKDMDYLKDSLSEMKNTIHDHIQQEEEYQSRQFEQMEKLLEKLDSKYANKWVEKIIVFLLSSAGTAIVGAFMYLILKH